MKNSEVIHKFLCEQEAQGSNLYSTGTQLISYSTCLAEWWDNKLLINETKYSVSTSKWQNKLFFEASQSSVPIFYVGNQVPMGTSTLHNLYTEAV